MRTQTEMHTEGKKMEKKMGPGGNLQLQGIVDVPRGDGSALTGMKK